MFNNSDKVIVLKDWPQPEAGAPEPCIYADDSNFVIRYYTQNRKIAVVVFPLADTIKFGSPNDESLGGHPLIKSGLKYYSIHKVVNSSWIAELEKQNSVHPQHDKNKFVKDKHHYIFTFHDSTLELVATEGEYWKPVINIVNSEEEAKILFKEAQNA